MFHCCSSLYCTTMTKTQKQSNVFSSAFPLSLTRKESHFSKASLQQIGHELVYSYLGIPQNTCLKSPHVRQGHTRMHLGCKIHPHDCYAKHGPVSKWPQQEFGMLRARLVGWVPQGTCAAIPSRGKASSPPLHPSCHLIPALVSQISACSFFLI